MDIQRYRKKMAVAEEMRRHPTPAERKSLRYFMMRHQRHGWPHPESQVLIRGYIVDFLFRECSVIVEIDGSVHGGRVGQTEYDTARDGHLKKAGYTVLRFTNDDVLNSLENTFLSLYWLFKSKGCIYQRTLPERRSVPTRRVAAKTATPPTKSEATPRRPKLAHPPRKVETRLSAEEVRRVCVECGQPFTGTPTSDFCTADCCLEHYSHP